MRRYHKNRPDLLQGRRSLVGNCPPRYGKTKYRISSYSLREKYSFLNLEIQRSQYIRPKVTVHKCAETSQGRKLVKGGNNMRKYGILRKPQKLC